MSAIAGWVCYERGRPDTELLLAMSRAMRARGRDQRGAYVREWAWLAHNRSVADGGAPWFRQPLTVCRDRSRYTVVLDGRVWARDAGEGVRTDVMGESDAALVLDHYLAYGTSFAAKLSGRFAVAIMDERWREMILATDAEGSRPLFYAKRGGEVMFASEIKGILRGFPEGCAVNGERVREYLNAPIGEIEGSALYRGIESLPPSTCAVISRFGVTTFAYDTERKLVKETEQTPLSVKFVCPDESALRRDLTECLFAFDYPAFDFLMPSMLRWARQRKESFFAMEDDMMRVDARYAKARADRIGQSRGKVITPVVPRTSAYREKGLRKMEKVMSRLLEETDKELLCRMYGEDWRQALEAEKNIAARIRMQGILYQSDLWAKHYPLIPMT